MTDAKLDLELLPPSTVRRMEQVIAAVRAAIDDGRMKPGLKYSVYQLAEALGISRTPVREALLRLEEAGLIKFEARQGFRIVLPQPKEIAEIFAVRLALELPAVRRAAGTTDPSFRRALIMNRQLMQSAAIEGNKSVFAQHDFQLHDLILEAADNGCSRAIVTSLRETIRLLGASTAGKTRSLTEIENEHAPIIAAILAGDSNSAEAAMRDHLVRTGKLLIAQVLQNEDTNITVEDIWSSAISFEN
ncbi:GntR family transcriptional regulator [Rhodococcus globerulus]|uniref:GntR family transcriptional regulator n=1 Tax=Rhodococcus globerulus TaxID=33008 RepID=UPI0005245EFE|nr:GntR family transcriptional regulator [Rhodococcus globerulus]